MSRWPTMWRRVSLATAFVVALYIALDVALVAVQRALVSPDLARAVQRGGLDTAALARRAEALARESAAREAALAPASRADAFLAGHQVGVASTWLALALVPPNVDRTTARGPALLQAQAIANDGGAAARLGLPPLQPLLSETLGEFSRLAERVEADEGGTVAALRAATSPRHAHLYWLGFHAGAHAYRLVASPTVEALPPGGLIERHAMLAGVAPELWQPLAMTPPGATPEQRRDAYLAAVRRVREGLAISPPGAVQPAPGR